MIELATYLLQQFWSVWALLGGFLVVVAMVIAAAHAVLYKEDTRSAVGWVGLIWFAPLLGVVLYFLFGINRIQRRAKHRLQDHRGISTPDWDHKSSPDELEKQIPPSRRHLSTLSTLIGRITDLPLLKGNEITPLVNGGKAYPAMLEAIENAQQTITLSTYIFDNDRAGQRFRDALNRAAYRGVDIRVLVDDVGARYSFPPMTWGLRRDGIRTERFMQTLLPWRFRYNNLRNHRKIMVVDGRLGFTGGMNIREGFMDDVSGGHSARDLHFKVEGPVVAHLQRAFAEDWVFVSGEVLSGERWFPDLESRSTVFARGIADGPDEDYDKLRWTVLGALSCSDESVQVMTPYFLPDSELLSALSLAAMRGVNVEILLPEENNLRMVHWASMATVEPLLKRGVKIFLTPPPFDHSKLMIVDELWSLIGSTNWDPRSFRLNFEFNVECYDSDLASSLQEIFKRKKEDARRLRLKELRDRSLPVKLRDGIFRLFSPYL